MDKSIAKLKTLQRRKWRIKRNIKAQKGILRLCIFKSNKSFYAQIIDDEQGKTVFGLSTLADEFKDLKSKKNIDAAKIFGKVFAEKAAAKGFNDVVFDRNGNLYHGKIKAFAEAARENGLKF